MSTKYYKLRDGVTLQYGELLGVPAVMVHVNGVRAGVLLEEYVYLLSSDDHAAVRSGGRTTVYATGPDSDYAVSEYHEIVTLGELRRNEQP